MTIQLGIGVPGTTRRVLPWEGDGEEISVGRSARADLLLPDPRVSGLHLVLRWDAQRDRYRVRDEGSLNGTRLNGRRLGTAEVELAPQDVVALGRVRLTVLACSPPGRVIAPSSSGRRPASAAEVEELLRAPPQPGARARLRLAELADRLRPPPGTALDALLLLVALAAAALLAWVAAGC